MPPRKQTQPGDLHFERKNQNMVKLPKYARVQKRPIPHPPIASPYAGPSTPKTVYVSTTTPFMSAVKRVQKLLRHAEKRATSAVDLSKSKSKSNSGNKRQGREEALAEIVRAQERVRAEGEKVFVKATGRAIQKALSVGKWFGEGGREAEYNVEVRTGAVLVVDDVEVDEGVLERVKGVVGGEGEGESGNQEKEKKERVDGSISTMTTDTQTSNTSQDDGRGKSEWGEAKPLSKSALKKRKRAASLAASIAETELPETRTRWVNSVEVAVSLK